MNEIWKDIANYEGKYMVSNLGRVKSLKDKYGNHREKILKCDKNSRGYLQVNLYKNGEYKVCSVHRLVAQAFIHNPNPQHYTLVNHIDENKSNNNIENLEWCTAKYNCNHGTRNERVSKSLQKAVIGINKINGYIVEFSSIKEAGRVMSIPQQSICWCCKGKIKSAGNYRWFYANSNKEGESK